MKQEEFRELLVDWCSSDSDAKEGFTETKVMIDFFERVLFEQYVPVKGGVHGNFSYRLARWIGSATTDIDRKNLFLLLQHLFFMGKEDMESAMLTAYSKNILMWLIEKNKLSFFSGSAKNALEELIKLTAFTGITDSFDLATFIRLNNVHGERERYNWDQNLDSWDEAYFIDKVLVNGTKRFIVLFEDFVGSGSQAEKAIRKACTFDEKRMVLFCPMMICPKGAELARKVEAQYKNFTYSPVLELPLSHFITSKKRLGEKEGFKKIRRTLINVHPKVAGSPGSWAQNYGPFGYQQTGAILVKYDNCPDNSIPVLHYKSDLGWEPLFYRASREPIK